MVATGQELKPMIEPPLNDPPVPPLKEWISQLQNTWLVMRKALADAPGGLQNSG